jgi:16S rRNA (cytidine1402-2'-O)-methyltransferase
VATLYVVATPIGNLEDITLRALRVLREVAVIAAEDTRTTRKLLAHYGIQTRLISYTEHNAAVRTPQILALLHDVDVALVSEAGTPAISDPGARLVEAVHQAGLTVSPVPGPSALPAALAVAGALAQRGVVFLGFLPSRASERHRLLALVAPLPFTLVIFEAPHRLRSRLKEIQDYLGDRPVVVCRELTKLYEEVFRGSVSDALNHFAQPRGEFVLVIGGREGGAPDLGEAPDIARAIADLRREGYAAKEAVAVIAKRFNLPRRTAYALWLSAEPAADEER